MWIDYEGNKVSDDEAAQRGLEIVLSDKGLLLDFISTFDKFCNKIFCPWFYKDYIPDEEDMNPPDSLESLGLSERDFF